MLGPPHSFGVSAPDAIEIPSAEFVEKAGPRQHYRVDETLRHQNRLQSPVVEQKRQYSVVLALAIFGTP